MVLITATNKEVNVVITNPANFNKVVVNKQANVFMPFIIMIHSFILIIDNSDNIITSGLLNLNYKLPFSKNKFNQNQYRLNFNFVE